MGPFFGNFFGVFLSLLNCHPGLLEWGRKNLADLKVQERYYEKLHDWEKALKIYAEKAADKPDDADIALGRMRCLEKLGEWGDLHAVAEAQWQVRRS